MNQWRRKEAKGDAIIVRYADDVALGFQHRYEAGRFLEQLREARKFRSAGLLSIACNTAQDASWRSRISNRTPMCSFVR